jgi:hypothetical protein
MATRKQRVIKALIEQWAPELQASFLASIDTIRNEADFTAIVAALTRGDIGAALDALHIDAGAFSAHRAKIAQAYAAGGEAGAKSMPKRYPNGGKLIVRFDATAPSAEAWLRTNGGNAIAEITQDQLDMARVFMTRGLAAGNNPKTMALDLVGRYNKTAGKRTGGVIGLTQNQEKIVNNVRNDLALGDPKSLKHYLGLTLRDKRLDRYVVKAINDPTQVISADIKQKIISRYADASLLLRGETIGRTEALGSLHAGNYNAFEQAVDKGQVALEEVEREWDTAGDKLVRDSHAEMDGETIGLNETYSNGLQYPGDPSGAAEEIIACRCTEGIRINFLNRLR